jgi:hypothetical protein
MENQRNQISKIGLNPSGQQGGNPPPSVTLDSICDLYSFLAEAGNPEMLYAALSDREALVGEELRASRSRRGLPPYDDVELFITLRDWKPVLAEIPSFAIRECFTRAIASHNADNPFQSGEVVTIWREMSESTKSQLYERHRAKRLPPGPPCEWCGGTGFTRINASNVTVKLASPEETNRVVVCDCRKIGASA